MASNTDLSSFYGQYYSLQYHGSWKCITHITQNRMRRLIHGMKLYQFMIEKLP